MQTILDELRKRQLLSGCTDEQELSTALQSGSVTYYCGFDPTAPSLHLGNLVPIMMMRLLQKRGHTPIVVIGTGTGFIGDPSGKSSERNLLDLEKIMENADQIEKQFRKLLPMGNVTVVRNGDWLSKLSLFDFLRGPGKAFSVNTMIAKESVKSRLENREQGISFTEFTYMLLQSYDFWWLYKQNNCVLQLGGSDQWGNITAGTDLIGKLETDAKAFGMTFPLLLNSDGKKFGKSEGGAVWVDRKLTSPYKLYQFWMNLDDVDVVKQAYVFSERSYDEVVELIKTHQKAPEKRLLQRELAREITTLIHSAEDTANVEKVSEILFGAPLTDISEETFLSLAEEIPTKKFPLSDFENGISIVDLLINTETLSSKSEARKAIENGGIYLNNVRVTDPKLKVGTKDLYFNLGVLIRQGKKNYRLGLVKKIHE
jgi:tyrosyl-tRNA synthetase